MKRFSSVCILLCIAIVLCTAGYGCKQNDTNSLSLYIYMCGSNLETKMGAAGKNINELLSADIPENVNIIIQTGGAKKWRAHNIPSDSLNLWQVKNRRLNLLKSLPQGNMGESQTFTDFLNYGVESYPADKMCVIIWDHGGGSVEGVANDENYGFDSLTLSELNSSLEKIEKLKTKKLELFGFDACLMSNYETASMLSPYASYMLASEEIEPSGGWNYKALITALSNNNANGETLGKAVCDGYLEKCVEQRKDASATLALTDLNRLSAVQDSFDRLAMDMKYRAEKVKGGIKSIAYNAHNAPKFGGTTSDEGYSNLIDLLDFAKSEKAEELEKAVNNAVVYKVCGKDKSNSGGLSFYYPLKPNETKLNAYCNEVCPSEDYKGYLKEVFENIVENPINFEDCGSRQEDGSFGIKLSESSKEYLLSVDFMLVEFNNLKGKNETFIDCICLGLDNDLNVDMENLEFRSNFRGVWLALNGRKLFVTPVESNENEIIFTSPIKLNNRLTNLRFAFVYDDSEQGGYYKILGAWDGIDLATGMSSKEIYELKPSDDIEVLYYYQELTIRSDGSQEGSEEAEEKFAPVPKGDYHITEDTLENEDYAYQFVITDIYGNRHYSYLAHMKMKKSYKEDEFAADIKNILETQLPVAE